MFPFRAHSFALILLDGQRPSRALFDSYRALAQGFIAVDGAATWAIEHSLRPDLIIGDLDSFRSTEAPCPLKYEADQNSNDLEKTIIYALHEGFQNILIMGAFGLRADHFLTNIFVLKKYAAQINMVFVDDLQIAFMCPAGKNITLENMLDSFFSLFPLAHQVGPITTQGVQYPLNQETLSLHTRIGTLNKITSLKAQLRCESEDLLVFLPHQPGAKILID